MPTRINGLTTATSIEEDDYLVIDGATSGTRKALVYDVGGEREYTFTTSLTPSIDARGITTYSYIITPKNADDLTIENASKTKAYLQGSGGGSALANRYPLIITYCYYSASTIFISTKSIYGSPQSTTSTTISGKLIIVAPYEITSVTASM